MMDKISITHNMNLKKRERTQNWTPHEKEILFSLVKPNIRILENKRATPNQKGKIWKIIHARFNKVSPTERGLLRVREQWRRMKSYARLEISSYNDKVKYTGWRNAVSNQPSKLGFRIWRLCESISKLEYENRETAEGSETTAADSADSSRLEPINNVETNLPILVAKRIASIHEPTDIPPDIKEEIESDDSHSDGDSQDENNETKSSSEDCDEETDDGESQNSERKKMDLTELNGRVNGDFIKDSEYEYEDKENKVATELATPPATRPVINTQIPRIYIRENLHKKPEHHIENNQQNEQSEQSEQSLKIELLNIRLECARMQRETAVNELKASRLKRQMIEKEAAEKLWYSK